MKTLLLSKVSSLFLLLALVISFGSGAANPNSYPLVKQSSSGICHNKSSGSFNGTKNYTSFDTIAAFIEAGGSLLKGKVSQINKAAKEAIGEARALVSFYNKSDWPQWLDDDEDCQNTRHEILIQTSN
jgi:hypothetical protein